MISDSKRVQKIAILMASFNGESHIERQVETIVSQKSVDLHLFVSDDNSTDSTIEILEELSSKYKNITVLDGTQKFGSAGANFLNLVKHVDVSKFDYVAFSDQDDIWVDDKIISAVNQLVKGNASGFSSDVIAFWPERNIKRLLRKSYNQTTSDFWFESPGPGCSQVFTKDSFEKFKIFAIDNSDDLKRVEYHDWLIYAFYRYNNLGWIISKEPKILYRQHGGNQIGANFGVKAFWKRIRSIKSGWYIAQIQEIAYLISNGRVNPTSRKYLNMNALALRRRLPHSIMVYLCFVFRIL